MTAIFAHRGFAAHYSENTMTAFMKAAESGADGIELDVQLTKDGIPVVIHDEKTDRTTGAAGFVKDYTYSDLRKLNADFKQSSGLGMDRVPSLEEVLEWLAGTNLLCNIELKNGIFPYQGIEEKVIALIRSYRVEEKIILSSFNHYSLVHCWRIAPDLELAALFSELIYMPWVYAQAIRAKGIHPRHIHATEEIITSSREHGIAVRPYTVNRRHDMERLITAGCDAIITDDPAFAISVRREMQKRP